MKDLNLPKYTEQQIQNIWDNLKENDVLVCIERNTWSKLYDITYYKVKNKTPKGNIRLTNGDLIKDLYSNCYLLDNDLKLCINKINLEIKTYNLIHEIYINKSDILKNLEYERIVQLEKILSKIVGEEEINN